MRPSSGVTTHSCDTNVLSRQIFVLQQPTVSSQRSVSQPGRLQDALGAEEEELLVLTPRGGCEDSNCVDKDTFLHFPCTLGFNWLWKMEDSVITEMDYLSVWCP